ncbi:MAG: thioesterase family protein [Verrucomicrobiae bacterium]
MNGLYSRTGWRLKCFFSGSKRGPSSVKRALFVETSRSRARFFSCGAGVPLGTIPGMDLPDQCRISTDVRVMYFDTDAGGVVHNIVYLRFIETARTLLAIQMGMSFGEIARTNIHPVVTRTEIDYKRPARLGDEIRVDGRVVEWSAIRFWVEFEIVRPSDGALLVKCRQALALVQMPEGRPIRLPSGFPASLSLGG